jgi:pyrroloquinoline quinone (PQQ) biosynthesis protein C
MGLDGSLAHRMRERIVERFYGTDPPEGIRRLFHPDRAFQAALIFEHWQFLQGFPRWVGSIIAGTPHLDVIEYEVDNLYGELIHDPGVKSGHYALVLEAGVECGLSREEIQRGPPGPKMARAIADWYAIARERPWVETLAAVHGTEMLADQRLRELPGYRLPNLMGDEEFLAKAEYTPAGRRFLATTRADTAHAGRAMALVEKYAPDGPTREAVLRTFERSLDDMALYFEALVERARAFEERFGR